jgi:hypothetical protein
MHGVEKRDALCIVWSVIGSVDRSLGDEVTAIKWRSVIDCCPVAFEGVAAVGCMACFVATCMQANAPACMVWCRKQGCRVPKVVSDPLKWSSGQRLLEVSERAVNSYLCGGSRGAVQHC